MDTNNSSLYHYTSGDGLIGILQNKCLWATDINFLNDHREFELGSNLINDYFKNIVMDHLDSHNINTGGRLSFDDFSKKSPPELASVMPNMCHTTISFTTKFDCLRHWISYCNSKTGYCIEFNKKALSQQLKDNDLLISEIVDVNYIDLNKDNFQSEIDFTNVSTSMSSLTANLKEDTNTVNTGTLQYQFIKAISEYVLKSASIKSLEWSDEAESRFIGSIKNDGLSLQERLSFREKSGVLIPYIACNIGLDTIDSITIGPSSNPDLAEKGLLSLRKSLKADF